ncbi:DUF2793 domain-containing protein [Phreatobacter sp. AB_2022a]|uniref:DUF2793 domain-containing protein n=1 Tax=Phreatobacter sp. AB_2022a TaxID=3003134 RepID=UPI002286E450|nr:DUF2793 domain-containing protein [Phreatobacter sp. AB_2022a]MCZ0734599.1 DUF2793 domain-containing protein [Phreatobacter sp. AB_2022a]
MAYDKLLTAAPGVWTITLAQGSATAPVAGILLVTAGAREGDAVLDDEGRVLVIKALTETEITFAWPYKATTRTIDLVIEERSINRAINTASSAAAIAALARLQNAANLAPNYPVLSHGNTPPAVPADGDRHLVGLAPTGVWAGKAKHLALYSAATAEWSFTPPEDGMSVVLAGTSARLQYNGAKWGLDALGAAGGQLTGPLDWAPAVDVASAPIMDLGAANSNLINITGTAAILSLGMAADGVHRTVKFADIVTLVHSPVLMLPGGLDITTANGDGAEFVSRGSGNWQCFSYTRIDGTPLGLRAGSVATAKLADAAVTNTKLADMATSRIKGRASVGMGAPEDLSRDQVRNLIGLPTTTTAGRVPRFGDTSGTIESSSGISIDASGNTTFHAGIGQFAGAVGSRQAMRNLGWSNGQIRIQEELYLDGSYLLHIWDGAGNYVRTPLQVKYDGTCLGYTYQSSQFFGSSGIVMRATNTTSSVEIYGGDSYSNGAAISVFGKDVATANSQIRFHTNGVARFAIDATGTFVPFSDGAQDIGWSGARMRNIFATNPNIVTSDAAEKNLLGDDDQALLAAYDTPVQFWQWKSAVDDKGEDGARIHFGPTAQAFRDALIARGLDPKRYAAYCEDPLFDDVDQQHTVSEQAKSVRSVTRQDIELRDGRAVLVTKTVDEDVLEFDEVPVETSDGLPLLGADGKPTLHRAPRMVQVVKTIKGKAPRLDRQGKPVVRHGLRYEYFFAMRSEAARRIADGTLSYVAQPAAPRSLA